MKRRGKARRQAWEVDEGAATMACRCMWRSRWGWRRGQAKAEARRGRDNSEYCLTCEWGSRWWR